MAQAIELLKRKKIEGNDFIRCQAIIQSVCKDSGGTLGVETTENRIVLTFSNTGAPEKPPLSKSIMSMIQTCVTDKIASAVLYGLNDPKLYPDGRIELKMTIDKEQPSSSRDRDKPVRKFLFTNAINDSFEHVGLSSRDLATAQTIQRYMINNHKFQPLVTFTAINSQNRTAIIAEDVDHIDLAFLGELVRECKGAISDIVYSRLVSGKFELLFEIEKNITEVKNKKSWFLF